MAGRGLDIALQRRGNPIGDPSRDVLSDDSPAPVVTDEEQHNPAPSRNYQMLLLASGFFMTFHVIGINSVYGIFQEFYTSPSTNITDAQRQDAQVSLIGTFGSGLTWSGSIFVNPLIARFMHVRLVSMSGVIIMSLGLFLASYSTKLWHLFITQALIYGAGSSMYYFPIMSLAPIYFDRNRGFAMGVILAGSGVGGLVIAPVLQILLEKYGIQWSLRILAIWNLAIGLPVSSVIKHRPGFGFHTHVPGQTRARQSSSRINMGLLRRGTFWYQSLGAFLQAAGNVIPMYYMTSYAISMLAFSRRDASLLLAINSGVNSASRVAMGLLADRVGRQNTTIAGVLLSGLSVFALWYDALRSKFIAFVVIYGIYAGAYNALLPTTITEIYGVENYSSVNGFIYFIRGLGSIFGAPLAGVILGSYNRTGDMGPSDGRSLHTRYTHVVVYDGVLLLCATACVAYVRMLDAKDKGRWAWKA